MCQRDPQAACLSHQLGRAAPSGRLGEMREITACPGPLGAVGRDGQQISEPACGLPLMPSVARSASRTGSASRSTDQTVA